MVKFDLSKKGFLVKDFKKIIDISWPVLPSMTAYKNNRMVEFKSTKIFERDAARESVVTLGAHTGTHVDAPSHFMRDGRTIDQLDLASLIGPWTVIDMAHIQEKITAEDLATCDLQEGGMILFKTKNSALAPTDLFCQQFVYLDATAAQFLVSKKLRCVGIDYLGVERNQPGHETHTMLFEAGAVIIEGLRLQAVEPGEYFLCCLPLALEGLEAAPARAVLLQ